MPEPKDASLYEGPFASFYDIHFGRHALELAPRLLRFWSHPSHPLPLKDVLDLGCGAGHLDLPLLEAGLRVTGLDLSDPMLEKARARCARFLLDGRASFILSDISSFDIPGPFGAAVSSYNSINHLEGPERWASCFRSVRAALHPCGHFLFDFHTQKGLREWSRNETGRWEDAEAQVQGGVEDNGASAWMRVRGIQGNEAFDQIIRNFSTPLGTLRSLLEDAGFKDISFSDLEEIGAPLGDGESLDRVMVLARP